MPFMSYPKSLATRFILVAIILSTFMLPHPAQAEKTDIFGNYLLYFSGFNVGNAKLMIGEDKNNYAARAEIQLSGIAALFANIRGYAESRGSIGKYRLYSSAYEIKNSFGENKQNHIVMNLRSGNLVSANVTPGITRQDERVPISNNDLRGIIDPLSALLLAGGTDEGKVAEGCNNKVLRVFDGRERYNITLRYTRMDNFTFKQNQSKTRSVVCSGVFKAVSGHLKDKVANVDTIEIWFVRPGASVIWVPAKVYVKFKTGSAEILATYVSTN